MNLIVDIGNSRIKMAVMSGGVVVMQRAVERFYEDLVVELKQRYPQLDRAIVSSTGADAEPIAEVIRRNVGHCMVFDSSVPVPLKSVYTSPETLGADRMAAAVGVAKMYPERNIVMVDFGTAITIDLVTADGTFQGGFISCGVKMRFRALHDYTSRLPMCSPTEEFSGLGLSTEECMVHGVMQGVVGEIESHISRFSKKNVNLLIIFSGGDAKYFVKQIKNAIFADCEPVLCGLDAILEYNESK